MNLRSVVVAVVILSACKGKGGDGPYEIKRDVKRDTKMTTGLPSEMTGTFANAKPSLAITGVSGALADGMKAAIEKSSVAKQGGITIGVTLTPAAFGADGTADAKLDVLAYFAHPPKLSRVEGTLDVHLTYSNASPAQLGNELGEAITSWLDGEKLPAKLGVPTGTVPKVTTIAAGPPNCSLHEDGSVRCWDANAKEAILVQEAGNTISLGAANNFGACGVYKDGKAWCLDAWSNQSALEVREVCGVAGATAVSVGQSTACALLGDGRVRCWPREAAAYAPCNGPGAVEIAGVTDAIALETGPFDGCVVKKNGSVACWEHCGKDCKSGDVRVAPKATAVKGIADARQVVFAFQPCAWSGDDKIVCAANGDLKASARVVPEKIAKLVRGRMGACALSTQGNLWCASARAGDEMTKDGPPGLADASGGIGGSCGVTTNNDVKCWGGMSGTDPAYGVSLSY